MNLVEYWKKRCELAEAYIEKSPCDPDIYKEQLDAWNKWCEFKELPIPDVVGRSEQLKCQCKKAQFTRTVDAVFNPLCGRCGKAL